MESPQWLSEKFGHEKSLESDFSSGLRPSGKSDEAMTLGITYGKLIQTTTTDFPLFVPHKFIALFDILVNEVQCEGPHKDVMWVISDQMSQLC